MNCAVWEFVMGRSKPRVNQFGANCHSQDWVDSSLSQSVRQSTIEIRDGGDTGAIVSEVRQICSRAKLRLRPRRQSGVY